MRLLVTGGAGFIGSNLIHRIIDQPEIEMLVNLDCLTYAGHLKNLESVAAHPKYLFEAVDLRNKLAVFAVLKNHRISHVMHLAAESHVDRSIAGPGDFIQTNVVGTFHLLEACRELWLDSASPLRLNAPRQSDKRGIKDEGQGEASLCQDPSPTRPGRRLGEVSVPSLRFLHVSTDEVYGSLGPTGYFTETTPYAPNSPYSASKAASDMLVRAYHHTYGLPVVTTNCSNNYGPYQFPEKLVPVVIQNIVERTPIPVYDDGMNVRDWLYVRDHAEALWSVLCRGRDGETYNIGGHNEWPNIRIVELICDVMDELAPELGGNSRKLITFVKDRPGHDRRYAIDASKIARQLGWKPVHEFETGIRETVRWYLANQSWVREVLSGTGRVTA